MSTITTQTTAPRLLLNAPPPGPTFSIVVPVHNEMAGLAERDKLVREEEDGSETAIPPGRKVRPRPNDNFYVAYRDNPPDGMPHVEAGAINSISPSRKLAREYCGSESRI